MRVAHNTRDFDHTKVKSSEDHRKDIWNVFFRIINPVLLFFKKKERKEWFALSLSLLERIPQGEE